MPLPAIKLMSLVVKQLIGKPIANRVKEAAKNSPRFKNSVVLPLAQFYTRTTVQIKSRMLGIGKVESVEPISIERAVDLMGDFAGEVTIVVIAISLVFLEMHRQNQKVESTYDAYNDTIESLKDRVEQLELVVKNQTLQTEKMEEVVKNLNQTVFYSQHGITSKILNTTEEQKAAENKKSKS
ncbi:optic atrophy 3 protein homolog [Pecten maximus]|uniref:optic atrophy 3 protein homolog n=1 Tax=Pecten maximus TaxID=6579 RepID=UPI0014585852|nr:optic atrophy 3 protein homolog [Pecten maximus]